MSKIKSINKLCFVFAICMIRYTAQRNATAQLLHAVHMCWHSRFAQGLYIMCMYTVQYRVVYSMHHAGACAPIYLTHRFSTYIMANPRVFWQRTVQTNATCKHRIGSSVHVNHINPEGFLLRNRQWYWAMSIQYNAWYYGSVNLAWYLG